jgi:hypothetical protein
VKTRIESINKYEYINTYFDISFSKNFDTDFKLNVLRRYLLKKLILLGMYYFPLFRLGLTKIIIYYSIIRYNDCVFINDNYAFTYRSDTKPEE